jgi:hypothetical protein
MPVYFIEMTVEWKDKADSDVGEDDEEEVRRPGHDWFGVE